MRCPVKFFMAFNSLDGIAVDIFLMTLQGSPGNTGLHQAGIGKECDVGNEFNCKNLKEWFYIEWGQSVGVFINLSTEHLVSLWSTQYFHFLGQGKSSNLGKYWEIRQSSNKFIHSCTQIWLYPRFPIFISISSFLKPGQVFKLSKR